MDNQIILAISRQCKTLADGTLRMNFDFEPNQAVQAMQYFGGIGTPVAIAVLKADNLNDDHIGDATEKVKNSYAQGLYLSSFFRTPDVWRAIGSDEEFLDWLEKKPCFVVTHAKLLPRTVNYKCNGDVCANHVRRVANGAGTSIKPPYSAIPGCHFHHQMQTSQAESYFGGKEVFDKMRINYVHQWARETLKATLGFTSWSLVPYQELFDWAVHHGVEKYLKPESEY